MDDDMSNSETASRPEQPGIAFDYIKSNFFRVIHANGAIGGPTPQGHLHIAFYSERAAIPRRVVHELNTDGTLRQLREVQSRDFMARELDVDVFLSIDAAESLHIWLGQQIEIMKAINDGTK